MTTTTVTFRLGDHVRVDNAYTGTEGSDLGVIAHILFGASEIDYTVDFGDGRQEQYSRWDLVKVGRVTDADEAHVEAIELDARELPRRATVAAPVTTMGAQFNRAAESLADRTRFTAYVDATTALVTRTGRTGVTVAEIMAEAVERAHAEAAKINPRGIVTEIAAGPDGIHTRIANGWCTHESTSPDVNGIVTCCADALPGTDRCADHL